MRESVRQNPVLLYFDDKEMEHEFKRFYELDTRNFIRLGFFLAFWSWAAIGYIVYLVVPESFSYLFVISLLIHYPYLVFAVYSTYKERYVGYYQLLAAVENILSGLLVIYIFSFFPTPAHYIAMVLVAVMIFGHFIFRLKLYYVIFTSLFYTSVFQLYLVFSLGMESPEMVAVSFFIWNMVLMLIMASYFAESTHRKLFLQKTMIKDQQKQIAVEYERAEGLLLNILPKVIATRLKEDQSVIADYFNSTSVLFADIVGFTDLPEKMPPGQLVEILNNIFSRFDKLAEEKGLEKIKTIGDAYMVAGGLPNPRVGHIEDIADFSLAMNEELESFNVEYSLGLEIRVGLHIGPAIAGVIGIKKFAYDMWGDTVNMASRLESHGLPGKIHVSEQVYEYLKNSYVFSKRGGVDIKGKGEVETFFLLGKC